MSREQVQNWKNVIRQSIYIAKVELGRCFFSTRALILVVLFIYLKGQISNSLLELTKSTGEALQMFEPAIAVLVVIGNVLCYLEVEKVMWFFPMANTQVWLRHQEILSIQQFPLYLSYVYFFGFLLILGLLTYVRLKKGNIQSELC